MAKFKVGDRVRIQIDPRLAHHGITKSQGKWGTVAPDRYGTLAGCVEVLVEGSGFCLTVPEQFLDLEKESALRAALDALAAKAKQVSDLLANLQAPAPAPAHLRVGDEVVLLRKACKEDAIPESWAGRIGVVIEVESSRSVRARVEFPRIEGELHSAYWWTGSANLVKVRQ